jgi:hypothetical protein
MDEIHTMPTNDDEACHLHTADARRIQTTIQPLLDYYYSYHRHLLHHPHHHHLPNYPTNSLVSSTTGGDLPQSPRHGPIPSPLAE